MDQNSQRGTRRETVGGLLSLRGVVGHWPGEQQKGDGLDCRWAMRDLSATTTYENKQKDCE